eukprot:CAMPEP_0198155352 /NCGR_PEP_ID=MMETSP1443-20131203/69086_1 /TAXON_ID=186043 /ORGANISM="Entomoneis sp., Strain CCMP2396" /LENGTH=177 /DNA_ID=CAMNT_0043822099 /DNA_START=1282 /DNA_END=1815 /DNA_ORIENTATION=-
MKFQSFKAASAVASLVLLASASVQAFVKPTFGALATKYPASSTQVAGVFDFLKEGKKALVKSLAGDFDEPAIRARLDNLVSSNKVLMLALPPDPSAVQAKELLDGLGAKYTVVELDTDPDGKAIRAVMGDILGRTSVPAVWIDGVFVGGCNDGPLGGVNKLNESGELVKMLRKVKAL